MEAASEDVLGDEEFFLLAEVEGDEGEKIGVGECAQAAHVLLELLLAHAVHLLESLHRHGGSRRKHHLVGRPQSPDRHGFSRSLEQVVEFEPRLPLPHHHQLRVLLDVEVPVAAARSHCFPLPRAAGIARLAFRAGG